MSRAADLRVQAMNKVVDVVHCFKDAYIYGGYVRDYVMNGETPRDLDIVMPCRDKAVTFKRFLSTEFSLEQLAGKENYDFMGKGVSYEKHRVTLKKGESTMSFEIDITIKKREELVSIAHDFTCNMLYFWRSGIELLHQPVSIDGLCSPFLHVRRQLANREFSLVSDSFPQALTDADKYKYVKKLIGRAEAMVRRGWTFVRLPGSFEVNRFERFQKSRALDEITECSICKLDFSREDVCVMTDCAHLFHTACLTKWLETGRSKISCPNCRSEHLFLKKADAKPHPVEPARSDRIEAEELPSDWDESEYEEEEDEDDPDYTDNSDVEEIDGMLISVSDDNPGRDSSKTDGIRKLLCAKGETVSLVDRAYNMTKVHASEGPEFRATVLDGELIGERIFLVFDAVVVSGQVVGVSELLPRLDAARRWVDEHANRLDGLQVKVKRMLPWKDAKDFALRMYDRAGTDGLLFTPAVPLLQRHQVPTLKWKKKEDITVDFLVFPRYELKVLDRGQLVSVGTGVGRPGITKTRVDIDLRKGKNPIVECIWHPGSNAWRMKKIRTDKDQPNSMLTFRNSLKNLSEDIKLEELFD
ncbi:mRNA-capping enzyme [Klebsormidium nitens]|uniref:mRNA guanylyltransferase n=1 Tax=Klebsormidium nitens TaxID=105231 RepID=A0A1Y1IFV8_KLENI|nr:mRNA-capping enzyme [Klebsormidium nitens]|eukprot:GAQ89724.1 mRNA-capping enzyme [Klebsormidium nitens]